MSVIRVLMIDRYFICRLRGSEVRVRFVTNTTKESLRVLHDRLTRIGFEISQDEIFTSLSAARDLIVRESLRPMLLVDEKAMEDFQGALSTLRSRKV